MKFTVLSLLLFLSALTLNAAEKTAKNLNLKKYLGAWHQVAAIPNSFQKDCHYNSKAKYTRASKKFLRVSNSCMTLKGKLKLSSGRARVNPKFKTNSKLQVTFLSFLGSWIWAAGGDYWVLEIDSEYKWSLVGSEKKEYLWILSRTPKLSLEELTKIEALVRARNRDPCQLVMTRYSEDSDTVPEEEPVTLCELLDLES